jgi:hypothetical protein
LILRRLKGTEFYLFIKQTLLTFKQVSFIIRFMKNLMSLVIGTALLTGASAHAADGHKWDKANDPNNFESNYLYQYEALPANGSIQAQAKGWSDSYWPATRGYILDRWQQPNQAFKFDKYDLPAKESIPYLSQGELNVLSPAEKFDIIRGQYDLPIANKLKGGTTNPANWWKGLCNGWTRASLNINEPKAINFVSPITGKTVPLASGDVKALLDYYYANVDHANSQYVGSACRGLFCSGGSDAYKDVNPGAFHVIMANEFGIRKRGVSMDRDPGKQTWNQPYLGFESHRVGTVALPDHHSDDAVSAVQVETAVTYVNELYDTTDEQLENDKHVAPTVDPQGIGQQHTHVDVYTYILELDYNGSIIGGVWTGDSIPNHPDLIWRQPVDLENMSQLTKNMRDDWTVLREIVRQASGN